jgi:tyrosyl-tRNA synthetase
VSSEALDAGYPLVDALVGAGLAASKAEARRGLGTRGFAVNGEKAPAERPLNREDLLAGRYVVLQKGKRHYAMIEAW